MNCKQTLTSVAIVTAILASLGATKLVAQPFDISWYTIDSGGGYCSEANFELEGTIGQHDAGVPMSAGNFTLVGGFWTDGSTVPVEICPDTATRTAGNTSSGSSADICDEDSAIWTVQSTTFVAAFSPPPVAITFEGNTNPVGGTDVTLRLVGGPEFGNNSAFIQLRMWNFSTGAYQNTPFINQPDSDNTVYESTNPVADFVGPNGELRAEITCAKTAAGPVRLRMDQVEWQIQ